MLQIYNFGMRIGRRALLAVAGASNGPTPSKFMRFARGQRKAISEAEKSLSSLDRNRPTVWIHAASLGEFGIARPIIRAIRQNCRCNIVVTFFSPTGYEALRSRPAEGVDRVLYLPFDTSANVRQFLDLLRPDCAVFMVSEYWHTYLYELHRRNIPTFLVSAVIHEKSPFFKWYGNLYRKSISYFKEIFVLNKESKDRLESIGISQVTVNGDPLFDNVMAVASTVWEDFVIENFTKDKKVFIAGSIHKDEDLEMISRLANEHRDTRFIIVPHEIKASTLSEIESRFEGKKCYYSECKADSDFDDTQILIIDFVGALAYIYRYATWAYVGGGFTKFLHSIVEPAVYGLPVTFGPNIHRKSITKEMIKLGIGKVTSNFDELNRWFRALKDNPDVLNDIARKAKHYVRSNSGATQRIVNHIQEEICAKN